MHLHRRKFRLYRPYLFCGGESGIRTHGCFHIAGFQGRSFRPLSHLSVLILPGKKAAATRSYLVRGISDLMCFPTKLRFQVGMNTMPAFCERSTLGDGSSGSPRTTLALAAPVQRAMLPTETGTLLHQKRNVLVARLQMCGEHALAVFCRIIHSPCMNPTLKLE